MKLVPSDTTTYRASILVVIGTIMECKMSSCMSVLKALCKEENDYISQFCWIIAGLCISEYAFAT